MSSGVFVLRELLLEDGKRFRDNGVIVALGVSTLGRKYVLGIYEASTESSTACLELLNDLERRGLPSNGLLFIVDGGSGINKALETKYAVNNGKKREAIRLRCHFHKMANIEDALGKDHEKMTEVRSLFSAMRTAEDAVTACAHAQTLERLLQKINQSAYRSFLEAKTDLLALHDLGLTPELKRFFSTTNPIENVNSLTEEDLRRVKRWRSSEHFQRWYATSAMNAEKRMRKIRGYRGLPTLKEQLLRLTVMKYLDEKKSAA